MYIYKAQDQVPRTADPTHRGPLTTQGAAVGTLGHSHVVQGQTLRRLAIALLLGTTRPLLCIIYFIVYPAPADKSEGYCFEHLDSLRSDLLDTCKMLLCIFQRFDFEMSRSQHV